MEGKGTFCVFAAITLMIPEVFSSAILKMQFISYFNPTGKNYEGKWCDPFNGKCDPRFKFCFDHPTGSDSIDHCAFYQHETSEFQDTNYVDFTVIHDLAGLPNPFDTEIQKWPGKVKFKMEVWDDDRSHSAHDMLDTYNFLIEAPEPFTSVATAHWSSTRHKRGMRGSRGRTDSTSITYRYMVHCKKNYYGPDCSHFCLAQDDDKLGHYTCDRDTGDKICLAGWEDPDTSCKTVEDDCEGIICQNGGTCEDEYHDYECQCAPGYTGKHCEVDIDECAKDPCEYGGTCTDGIDDFTCICPPERIGPMCQYHVCLATNYCENGGTCNAGSSPLECVCPDGYYGDKCQFDKCDIRSCKNGGTCSKGECTCLPGFFGSECENDKCDPFFIACNNGGSCDLGVCTCAAGFTGRFCEINIDECRKEKSNPCLNSGTCVDDDGFFTCKCLPDFDGDICQRNLTPTWMNDKVTASPPPPSSSTTTKSPNALGSKVQVSSESSGNGFGVPTWVIIVIVIAIILLLAIVIIILVALRYRRKAKKSAGNGTENPAYMPQDINSLSAARSLAQQQQALNEQAAALQQAAAVQLAAAQMQAAYTQPTPGVQYARQNSGGSTGGTLYNRQDSTSSTAALLPSGGAYGGGRNNSWVAVTGMSPQLDNQLNAKLNNLEVASNVGSTRTAGGGNVYDDPDKLIRKGKMPPPPPVDLDIVAAAKATAQQDN